MGNKCCSNELDEDQNVNILITPTHQRQLNDRNQQVKKNRNKSMAQIRIKNKDQLIEDINDDKHQESIKQYLKHTNESPNSLPKFNEIDEVDSQSKTSQQVNILQTPDQNMKLILGQDVSQSLDNKSTTVSQFKETQSSTPTPNMAQQRSQQQPSQKRSASPNQRRTEKMINMQDDNEVQQYSLPLKNVNLDQSNKTEVIAIQDFTQIKELQELTEQQRVVQVHQNLNQSMSSDSRTKIVFQQLNVAQKVDGDYHIGQFVESPYMTVDSAEIESQTSQYIRRNQQNNSLEISPTKSDKLNTTAQNLRADQIISIEDYKKLRPDIANNFLKIHPNDIIDEDEDDEVLNRDEVYDSNYYQANSSMHHTNVQEHQSKSKRDNNFDSGSRYEANLDNPYSEDLDGVQSNRFLRLSKDSSNMPLARFQRQKPTNLSSLRNSISIDDRSGKVFTETSIKRLGTSNQEFDERSSQYHRYSKSPMGGTDVIMFGNFKSTRHVAIQEEDVENMGGNQSRYIDSKLSPINGTKKCNTTRLSIAEMQNQQNEMNNFLDEQESIQQHEDEDSQNMQSNKTIQAVEPNLQSKTPVKVSKKLITNISSQHINLNQIQSQDINLTTSKKQRQSISRNQQPNAINSHPMRQSLNNLNNTQIQLNKSNSLLDQNVDGTSLTRLSMGNPLPKQQSQHSNKDFRVQIESHRLSVHSQKKAGVSKAHDRNQKNSNNLQEFSQIQQSVKYFYHKFLGYNYCMGQYQSILQVCDCGRDDSALKPSLWMEQEEQKNKMNHLITPIGQFDSELSKTLTLSRQMLAQDIEKIISPTREYEQTTGNYQEDEEIKVNQKRRQNELFDENDIINQRQDINFNLTLTKSRHELEQMRMKKEMMDSQMEKTLEDLLLHGRDKDNDLQDLHLLSEDAVLNPESIADIVLSTKLNKGKFDTGDREQKQNQNNWWEQTAQQQQQQQDSQVQSQWKPYQLQGSQDKPLDINMHNLNKQMITRTKDNVKVEKDKSKEQLKRYEEKERQLKLEVENQERLKEQKQQAPTENKEVQQKQQRTMGRMKSGRTDSSAGGLGYEDNDDYMTAIDDYESSPQQRQQKQQDEEMQALIEKVQLKLDEEDRKPAVVSNAPGLKVEVELDEQGNPLQLVTDDNKNQIKNNQEEDKKVVELETNVIEFESAKVKGPINYKKLDQILT
eukprot:403357759